LADGHRPGGALVDEHRKIAAGLGHVRNGLEQFGYFLIMLRP